MTELEQLIEDKTRERIEELNRTLVAHEKYIEEIKEKLANARKEIEEKYSLRQEALEKLRSAGFEVGTTSWGPYLYVVLQGKQSLKDVYKAIGRLDPGTLQKEPAEEKWPDGAVKKETKNRVRCILNSAKYPFVQVEWFEKLKKGKHKCRIVTVKRRELVCDA